MVVVVNKMGLFFLCPSEERGQEMDEWMDGFQVQQHKVANSLVGNRR